MILYPCAPACSAWDCRVGYHTVSMHVQVLAVRTVTRALQPQGPGCSGSYLSSVEYAIDIYSIHVYGCIGRGCSGSYLPSVEYAIDIL